MLTPEMFSGKDLDMKKQNNSSLGKLTGIVIVAIFLLGACAAPNSDQQTTQLEQFPVVTVYKSAFCGCCSEWNEYLQETGFTVLVEEVDNLGEIKEEYKVPSELQSCHTAIVDGYVIEGHVPAGEIERLLSERPDIIGIAVPGMPPGSPGMETEGVEDVPYDVIAFDASGSAEVFASYP